MTSRERVIRTLRFENPDRLRFISGRCRLPICAIRIWIRSLPPSLRISPLLPASWICPRIPAAII